MKLSTSLTPPRQFAAPAADPRPCVPAAAAAVIAVPKTSPPVDVGKSAPRSLDTSHSPIGPCGPVEQSPFGDNLRHASMALLSSDFDCGEKTAVGRGEAGLAEGKTVNVPVHSFRNIDPPEPVNISILLDPEFTQASRQSLCLNDVAFQNM